ncbi:MAG TPA: BatD family protein [Bacteroidales bacterium]|mgnify:FL=1|nr:BatD family protein [Bacteroidales bacterium]
MKFKQLILFFLSSYHLFSYTQTFHYKAEATVDSNQILIGDHIRLRLSITADLQSNILFPTLKDTAIQGFEIIHYENIKIDTQENALFYSQNFTLTSFDSGTYLIPPIQFYNTDSILLAETQAIQIKVNTLDVDTTQAIKDIKPPLSVPLTWKEIYPYLIIGAIAALLVLLIIFLIKRIKIRKKPQVVEKQKPSLPAHIIALEALEKLRLKKLWQQGEIKQYYSELTDILRIYIENRWDIQAMEMVSSEIIESLNLQLNNHELVEKINIALSHADLVKFAKGNPLPNENQLSFDYIVSFVKTTALTDEQKENNKEL